MRPTVTLRTPDHRTVTLGHGDLIGRLESAALCLSDPRVSEAHAMVSLRGTNLQLLALRGRFAVDGKALASVELVPGLTVHLAQDLALSVEDVQLPQRVLGLRVGQFQVRVLTGVLSVFDSPRVELRPGFHPDALAHVWTDGSDSLLLRTPRMDDRRLTPGDPVEVGGVSLQAVEMALASDGEYATRATGGVAPPLELVTRYASAHIFRPEHPALVLTGLSARILSELVTFGVPVPWATVAGEIWPDEEADALRARWDVNLSRLRRKLEEAGVRADLVRSDGCGNVELGLEKRDVVRDES